MRELLERCLGSLLGSRTPLSTEIIVVDNNSNDGTADYLRSKFPSICVIANSDNRGFASANNQALRQARGRYDLILNPDTFVHNGAIEKLVKFMDSHPKSGACCPRLQYEDGAFQHSAFRFPNLFQTFFDLFPANWRVFESRLNGRYARRLYMQARPFRIDHPLGAAFLVRRSTVKLVGLMDEQYFMYSEEIDWAKRMHEANWEIWCVPDAVITHYEARSTRQVADKMYLELWRSRLRYFRKHHSAAYNLAVRVIVRAGIRRQERSARRAAFEGRLSRAQLAERLEVFRQVIGLANER